MRSFLLAVVASTTLSSAVFAGTILKSSDNPSVPTVGQPAHVINDDPWIEFNQPIFRFNLFFDRIIGKPVTKAYDVIPLDLRHNVSNFLENLTEPLNAVHGALRLDPNIFFTSFWRFILNTTFGMGGIRDFAREQAALRAIPQDLGKTLGHYGVDAGPYVVLPLLGPSSVRDTTGKVGDWFLDPVTWELNTPQTIGQVVADAIDKRDSDDAVVERLYYQSVDPYSASRSAYRQHEKYKETHE